MPRARAGSVAARRGAAASGWLPAGSHAAAPNITGSEQARQMSHTAGIALLLTVATILLVAATIAYAIVLPISRGVTGVIRQESWADAAAVVLAASALAALAGLSVNHPSALEQRLARCGEVLVSPLERLLNSTPSGLSPGAQASAATFGGVAGVAALVFSGRLLGKAGMGSFLPSWDAAGLACLVAWLAAAVSMWPTLPVNFLPVPFLRPAPANAAVPPAAIYLKCVREGPSKLRVRVLSPGFNADANCQFPRNLRVEGAVYRIPLAALTVAAGARGAFFYRVAPAVIDIVDEAEAEAAIAPAAVAPVRVGRVYRGDSPACVVCLDAGYTRICVPCGHMCMCAACDARLSAGAYNCPLCRAPIVQTISEEQMA